MSEWKECKLLELADKFAMGPFGSNIKAENFVNAGVPVIRGTNLNYHRFVDGEFVFLTEEKANELKTSNCFPGDIVFTHRGTIGQVGLIPNNKYPRYVISQSGMKVTVNSKLLDNNFLFYFFKSEKGQYELLQHESQVGVPSISNPLTSLKSVSVPLPPLPEQKAISSVLSSLDDKIDLLNRQNKTLEAMAEALFRQWFVEEAEENWEEGIISNYCVHHKECVQPQKFPEIIYTHYSIPAFDNGKIPIIETGSKIHSNKYTVMPNCLLFSKLNPHKDKRIWLINDLINDHHVCSTEFQVILPKKTKYLYFLYGWLSIPQNYNEIATGVGGTSGSHQRIDPSDIFNFNCPLIADNIIEKYNEKAEPIFSKIHINRTQILTLEKLRDTLLPKLMSGEVRVSV
jgi:type I restriction enzyme S subunit